MQKIALMRVHWL